MSACGLRKCLLSGAFRVPARARRKHSTMSFTTHQTAPSVDGESILIPARVPRGRRRAFVRIARPFAIASLLALSSLLPRPVEAQVGRAALGLIGGLGAGIHVTTGIFVLRSRVFGHDMHSTEDVVTLRPETVPIIAMPVAFGIVGYRSSSRLAGAATWGGLGLVAGAAVGAGVGHLLSGTSGGRWAGGTIGSAAGLALGAILGAAVLADDDGPDDAAIAPRRYVGISIPFGPGR